MMLRRLRLVFAYRRQLGCSWRVAWDKAGAYVVLDELLQAAILVTSAAAIWLVTLPPPYGRWGFVVGLVAQPLWFVETTRRHQWGVFLLAIFYTGAWVQGIYNHF